MTILLIIIMTILPFSATSVSAHNVTIFAWVDGDTVHTLSKFSGGRKAKNAVVEVYDTKGQKLLEGKTDETGGFSFQIPQKTELKVVLVAGTGHRGTWTIPVEEIEGTSTESSALSNKETIEKKEVEATTAVTAVDPLSESDVKRIVEEVLDKKLKPIQKLIAESNTKGPTLSDIFGGIGYILGLVGLGAYIQYRRKNKE